MAEPTRPVPEATVARLPVYLRSLVELAEARVATVSSERLAELAGVNAAKVRKDLSHLGTYGTRGVGYDVEYLLYQVSRQLGLTQDWPVVIVGVGNLGHALANYRGFGDAGFPVAALVDADARQVGERVAGIDVRHIDDLPAIVADHGVAIGVIATPAGAAQEVADRLVAAGVQSILNFAPALVSVPDDVPGAQGRPRRRAADPELLPAASRRARRRRRCLPTSWREPRRSGTLRPADVTRRPRAPPPQCPARAPRAHDGRARAPAEGRWPTSSAGTTCARRSSSRPATAPRSTPSSSASTRASATCATRSSELAFVAPEDLADHLYTYHDTAAVAHLFTVAAGLDSALLGESEILGQVRRAWEVAADEGASGPGAQPALPPRRRGGQAGPAPRPASAAGARRCRSAAVALAGDRLGGARRPPAPSCSAPATMGERIAAVAAARGGRGRRGQPHRSSGPWPGRARWGAPPSASSSLPAGAGRRRRGADLDRVARRRSSSGPTSRPSWPGAPGAAAGGRRGRAPRRRPRRQLARRA